MVSNAKVIKYCCSKIEQIPRLQHITGELELWLKSGARCTSVSQILRWCAPGPEHEREELPLVRQGKRIPPSDADFRHGRPQVRTDDGAVVRTVTWCVR